MTLVTQQAGDEIPQDQPSRGAASLQDIRLLEGQGRHLLAIMKGGVLHKNRLH